MKTTFWRLGYAIVFRTVWFSFCPAILLNVFRLRSSLAVCSIDEREMPVCSSMLQGLWWLPRTVFAAVLSDLLRPRPIILSTGNPASIFLMSRSWHDFDQPLLRNFFMRQRALQFFSTHNTFATVRSLHKILPIDMRWLLTIVLFKNEKFFKKLAYHKRVNNIKFDIQNLEKLVKPEDFYLP